MTPTTSERLHRDIHPAEVIFRGGYDRHPTRCRVMVTSERVIVWAQTGPNASPEIIVDDPIAGDVPARDRSTQFGELVIETEQGTLIVAKGEGCGCRSPLKYVQPPVAW